MKRAGVELLVARWLWVLIAGSAVLGCSRKSEPPKPRPAASSASSAPGPSASAARSVPPRPPHPAERVVLAWSDALSRRAADELPPFYSQRVLFYGQRKSASEVVAAKRQAFERVPKYQQRVSNLHFEKTAHGYVCRFDKQSGAQLESTVGARLVLEASGDRLTIAEESDVVTDRRLQGGEPKTCSEAVFRVVGKQPAIASDIARVAKEYPGVNPGGLTYDEAPDYISASQGYFHEDHYEPRWWIEAAKGELSLRDAYTDERLPLEPKDAAIVRQLCSGDPDAGTH